MSWPVPRSNPIARELEDFWKDTQSLNQQWQYEADIDTKMVAGQQEWANNSNNINRNSRRLQFNNMLRLKNMVCGYQIDSRLATIPAPSDNDLDNGETTDNLAEALAWSYRQDNTYEKISECFEGAVTCGLNLMHSWMDFRQDPENGQLRHEVLGFSSFLMDPYWTKQDLSDCNRIWTRRFPSKLQLKSLYPKLEKDIPMLQGSYGARDGKFQFLPQNYNQHQTEVFAYDEYWVKDTRTGRKLLDVSTGEVADWHGNREQFQMLRRINPNVQLIKAQIPTIKYYVLVNGILVYEEKSPWGLDRLPFVPFTCYHYKTVQNYAYRYQGIMRAVRDPQLDLNYRVNSLRDVLDAQMQSGVIAKEDAFVNPEDAYFQGPGKVMFLKKTANLATDMTIIPPPPVAPGWMELIASTQKEIMNLVGPEELFAQNLGAKEMSGVHLKLKMGAGLIGLRGPFDNLNLSQKILGEIDLDLILNNYSVGKFKAILGKEPSQLIQEATSPEKQLQGLSKQFLKYHCVVEEAELTSTQRELQFLQAVQLRGMGVPVPTKYLLEKSSLQDKKGLIETIMQEEQQQAKLSQAQAQAELHQSQMLARSLEAKAQADFGSAIERRSRAVSDQALAQERASQAEHDLASAALDNARAMKELDEMDEDRLYKLTDYILQLHERQRLQSDQNLDETKDAATLESKTPLVVEQETKVPEPQVA